MNLTIPGLTIICGLQGGGKSHLIRYIMHENQRRFNWGIVFTNTGFCDGNFDYVDKQYVHAKYSEVALVRLMKIHQGLIRRGKKPSAFVIFDDCLFGDQWKSEVFRSLMTQLRHYGIFCIISCQYPQAIPPLFRTNAFQVIMFTMATTPALKALFESYGQMFDTFLDFKKYLLEHTGDHQFVLYNARNGTASIEGRYSVMKAPAKIPKFEVKFHPKI